MLRRTFLLVAGLSLAACLGLGGGSLLSCAWAAPITNHDYCLLQQQAERLDCHAQHLGQKALCQDDRAFNLWIDFADAGLEYEACLDEAAAGCALCRTEEVLDCTLW